MSTMSGMLLLDMLLAQRQQEAIGKFNTVIQAAVKGRLLAMPRICGLS